MIELSRLSDGFSIIIKYFGNVTQVSFFLNREKSESLSSERVVVFKGFSEVVSWRIDSSRFYPDVPGFIV